MDDLLPAATDKQRRLLLRYSSEARAGTGESIYGERPTRSTGDVAGGAGEGGHTQRFGRLQAPRGQSRCTATMSSDGVQDGRLEPAVLLEVVAPLGDQA